MRLFNRRLGLLACRGRHFLRGSRNRYRWYSKRSHGERAPSLFEELRIKTKHNSVLNKAIENSIKPLTEEARKNSRSVTKEEMEKFEKIMDEARITSTY